MDSSSITTLRLSDILFVPAPVRDVAFFKEATDTHTLVAYSDDRCLRFWNVVVGAANRNLDGSSSSVRREQCEVRGAVKLFSDDVDDISASGVDDPNDEHQSFNRVTILPRERTETQEEDLLLVYDSKIVVLEASLRAFQTAIAQPPEAATCVGGSLGGVDRCSTKSNDHLGCCDATDDLLGYDTEPEDLFESHSVPAGNGTEKETSKQFDASKTWTLAELRRSGLVLTEWSFAEYGPSALPLPRLLHVMTKDVWLDAVGSNFGLHRKQMLERSRLTGCQIAGELMAEKEQEKSSHAVTQMSLWLAFECGLTLTLDFLVKNIFGDEVVEGAGKNRVKELMKEKTKSGEHVDRDDTSSSKNKIQLLEGAPTCRTLFHLDDKWGEHAGRVSCAADGAFYSRLDSLRLPLIIPQGLPPRPVGSGEPLTRLMLGLAAGRLDVRLAAGSSCGGRFFPGSDEASEESENQHKKRTSAWDTTRVGKGVAARELGGTFNAGSDVINSEISCMALLPLEGKDCSGLALVAHAGGAGGSGGSGRGVGEIQLHLLKQSMKIAMT
eukprot:g1800.t1